MLLGICVERLLLQDCKTGTMCQSLQVVGVSLHVVVVSRATFLCMLFLHYVLYNVSIGLHDPHYIAFCSHTASTIVLAAREAC